MKPKVSYLLFDFDGVFSLYLSQLNRHSPVYQLELKKYSTKNRAKFELFAQTICSVMERSLESSCKDAHLVILAVGSARQTRQHDHAASQYNRNNGLCFPLFADFASQKGWLYNRLLLPDSPHLPHTFEDLGKTMGPLQKNTEGLYVYKEDAYSDNLCWPEYQALLQGGKKELLCLHLAYIETYYPASQYDVTLEFWDDDLLHIRTAQAYAESHPEKLPATFFTRHFNWSETVKQYKGDGANFKNALETNLLTKKYAQSKKTSYLGLFSFSGGLTPECSEDFALPLPWVAVGLSALFLTIALYNKQKIQAPTFNLKSMY